MAKPSLSWSGPPPRSIGSRYASDPQAICPYPASTMMTSQRPSSTAVPVAASTAVATTAAHHQNPPSHSATSLGPAQVHWRRVGRGIQARMTRIPTA